MAKKKHEEEGDGMGVVELSHEEIADRAQKLAAAVQILNEVEDSAKETRKKLTKRVKDARAEVNRLARAVNTKRELRNAQRDLLED